MEIKKIKAGQTVYCAEWHKPKSNPIKNYEPHCTFTFECEKDCVPSQIAAMNRWAIDIQKQDVLVRCFNSKEEAEKALYESE